MQGQPRFVMADWSLLLLQNFFFEIIENNNKKMVLNQIAQLSLRAVAYTVKLFTNSIVISSSVLHFKSIAL
jgi:hypothetical protein